MSGHRLLGHINERHELVIQVPDSIPPGPVQVLLVPQPNADEDEGAWEAGISQEWVEELNDSRQDIYTLGDGEPLDAT